MTLDDLSSEKYEKAEKAIETFRNSKMTRNDGDVLYDVLTNVGLSAEYASEFIDMEVESNQ